MHVCSALFSHDFDERSWSRLLDGVIHPRNAGTQEHNSYFSDLAQLSSVLFLRDLKQLGASIVFGAADETDTLAGSDHPPLSLI